MTDPVRPLSAELFQQPSACAAVGEQAGRLGGRRRVPVARPDGTDHAERIERLLTEHGPEPRAVDAGMHQAHDWSGAPLFVLQVCGLHDPPPHNPSECNWNESISSTIRFVNGNVKASRAYHSPLRAEQADQTRQRVLVAASTLFLTRGYAGTTVKGVAEAAGVSPDTIYASLGGKKGLLEGVWAMAVAGPNDPDRRSQQDRIQAFAALPDPRERLRRLVGLSCETLGRASPIHAVLRAAADGHPFAADLQQRMLASRLDTQSRNLRTVLGDALRPGLEFDVAAEHYSALLSPELFHLLTVARSWAPDQFEAWVADTLTREFLAT